MKYDPERHRRRSIRLKGYDYCQDGAYFITICTHQRQHLFGQVIDGEMQLNEMGLWVQACWQKLPQSFPTLTLDAWVIMPNHLHGILCINTRRGDAFGNYLSETPSIPSPNASPPKMPRSFQDSPDSLSSSHPHGTQPNLTWELDPLHSLQSK